MTRVREHCREDVRDHPRRAFRAVLAKLALSLSLAGVAACDSPWFYDLPGNYQVVVPPSAGKQLQGKRPIDGRYPPVIDDLEQIAWDEHHILATSRAAVLGAELTTYWVIEVESGRHHGPLDAAGFERERSELGVDPALALRPFFDVDQRLRAHGPAGYTREPEPAGGTRKD